MAEPWLVFALGCTASCHVTASSLCCCSSNGFFIRSAADNVGGTKRGERTEVMQECLLHQRRLLFFLGQGSAKSPLSQLRMLHLDMFDEVPCLAAGWLHRQPLGWLAAGWHVVKGGSLR